MCNKQSVWIMAGLSASLLSGAVFADKQLDDLMNPVEKPKVKAKPHHKVVKKHYYKKQNSVSEQMKQGLSESQQNFTSSKANGTTASSNTYGIIEINNAAQLKSSSIGAAALRLLINGYVKDSNVSEQDIINSIRPLSGSVDDYSIGELESAAKKLGFTTITRTALPDHLTKFTFPTVLLVGLNTNFQHFVVFKGIRNETAYLFDPSVGENIRLPYKKLIEESISEEHPSFLFLAVKGSDEKLKNSSLYLSTIESERNRTHHAPPIAR